MIEEAQKKPKSQRGGKRDGAGPKRKSERQESAVLLSEQRCVANLSDRFDNLEELASGAACGEEEEYAAAGTVTVEDFLCEVSTKKLIKYRRLAFPDADPHKMVLVRRKVTNRGPDVRANMYLVDRAVGTPSSGDEEKVKELVGKEIDALIQAIRDNCDPPTAKKIIDGLANPDA